MPFTSDEFPMQKQNQSKSSKKRMLGGKSADFDIYWPLFMAWWHQLISILVVNSVMPEGHYCFNVQSILNKVIVIFISHSTRNETSSPFILKVNKFIPHSFVWPVEILEVTFQLWPNFPVIRSNMSGKLFSATTFSVSKLESYILLLVTRHSFVPLWHLEIAVFSICLYYYYYIINSIIDVYMLLFSFVGH